MNLLTQFFNIALVKNKQLSYLHQFTDKKNNCMRGITSNQVSKQAQNKL